MNKQTGLRAFQSARLRKQQKADADALFARAMALHQAGHVIEAEPVYRQILQNVPNHFGALQFLGVCEYQNGRYEEADRLLKQALSLDPRSAPAYSNRSLVLYAMKRFDEAISCCDKAIAIMPNYPEALNSRGNSLFELKRFEEALASYNKTIALKPNYPQAFDNRGAALFQLRRFEEALESYGKAVVLKPDYAEAWSNRGTVLIELTRFDEALASYDKALGINPNLEEPWVGRANIFIQLNRVADALASCQQALAIAPNSVKALAQLAQCHERQGNAAAALTCYDKALAIDPDDARAASNRIFALDFLPTAGFEEQQKARNYWWEHVGSKFAAAKPVRYGNDRDPERRLVIGYVSADLRQHSAALGFKPIMRHHDKVQFEVVCYSNSFVVDDVTGEFQAIADKWRNVVQLSDDAFADQIRADKVDILIDMSGHSAGHRLETFARKPAPVQVTYGTGNGLPTIDYLFADPVAIPAEVRHLFAETIYDLPCMMTIEPPADRLRPVDPPILSKGYATFGLFNRINKMSDEALSVWSGILRAQPQSRLVLKTQALDDAGMRALVTERFAKEGVSADRLDLLGTTSRDEHLNALKDVDICFDPFPQNGGISTWETLYMGVPVVAMLGNSVSSRLSAAILSSIGLQEWVGRNADDYAAIASKYASMPDHLKQLRHDLPNRIATSEAGNNVAFATAVGEGYRTIWRRYCERDRAQGAK